MYRFATCFALIIGFVGVAYAESATNLTASGETGLVIIDANGNGVLGDDGDCTLAATTSGGDLTVTPSQSDSATNPLRLCQGPCAGFGTFNHSSATATITDCDWGALSPGGPFVPACLEASSSVPSSSSNSCQSDEPPNGAGAGQGTQPLTLTAARLFYPGFEFIIPEPGFGFLCNAGGVAAEIATISGRRVITPLTRNGDYLCANMPFELVNGTKEFFDACIPVDESGNITLGVEGEGNFAVIPLSGLAGCGGIDAAPTASEFGLVFMSLVLLTVGAWALGRRPGFSASLPQI